MDEENSLISGPQMLFIWTAFGPYLTLLPDDIDPETAPDSYANYFVWMRDVQEKVVGMIPVLVMNSPLLPRDDHNILIENTGHRIDIDAYNLFTHLEGLPKPTRLGLEIILKQEAAETLEKGWQAEPPKTLFSRLEIRRKLKKLGYRWKGGQWVQRT